MADYFVRPVNGSDAADGLSFANAKKTFQAAYNLANSDGDRILCCVEAAEGLSSPISLSTTTFTDGDGNGLEIVAASSVDGSVLEDGTLYTITWPGQAKQDLIDVASGASYHRFRYIRFTAGERAYDCPSGALNIFYKCRFDNNNYAAYLANGSAGMRLIDCEVDHNTHGLRQSTSSRGDLWMVGGSIHDNTNAGVDMGSECVMFAVAVYGNGGAGIRLDATGNNIVCQCVIHDNGGSGILVEDLDNIVIVNNSITSNGAYGIDFSSSGYRMTVMNNLINGNTSGAMNGEISGFHNMNPQTGSPGYVDAESANFSPDSGSPLIGNGVGGGMIGIIAHEEGGGGGGTIPVSFC